MPNGYLVNLNALQVSVVVLITVLWPLAFKDGGVVAVEPIPMVLPPGPDGRGAVPGVEAERAPGRPPNVAGVIPAQSIPAPCISKIATLSFTFNYTRGMQ